MATSPTAETGVLSKPGPYAVELEPGKEYWYCTCGRSKNQPFCDGSHAREGTSFKPKKVTVDEKKTYYLCGCRETADASGVFCDGTHRKEKGLKKYVQHLLKANSELREHADKSDAKISRLHICAWSSGALSLVALAVAVKLYLDK